ncbi:radical SAM protein [Pseudomonas luteola]
MLTIYIKPTNFCNIGCEHCYLPEDVRANKNRMSPAKLEEVARFAKDMMERDGHKRLSVIWHGGEPMTLPPTYYRMAGEIFDNIIGYSNYRESIQTSLIPYTKEWAELVKARFNGVIGSSLDFSLRSIKGSSEDYINLWMKKVDLARQDRITVIPGMVPTRLQLGKGSSIIEWMVERQFYEFNIDRYSAIGSTSSIERPSNLHHAKFMTELFDACMKRIKNGLAAPKINVVTAAISGVLYGNPGDRWGTSCQRDFIVIEPDGSTNTCPDRAMHEKPYSNTGDGANQFASSKDRLKWIMIADITHKKSHCLNCEFRTWCKSGCPVTPNGRDEGENECSGYKSFLLHIGKFAESEENLKLCEQYLTG